jgi:hypothetical protein
MRTRPGPFFAAIRSSPRDHCKLSNPARREYAAPAQAVDVTVGRFLHLLPGGDRSLIRRPISSRVSTRTSSPAPRGGV